MTTVDKACPADVVKDLQKDYPGDRRLNETAAFGIPDDCHGKRPVGGRLL